MFQTSALAFFLFLANPNGVPAFSTFPKAVTSPSTGIFNAQQQATASRLRAVPDPADIASAATIGSFMVADKDWGEFTKSFLIVATLGGGLIPATIAANAQMFRTLSGKKDSEKDEDPSMIREGDTSFDPTIKETKYRAYVEDSGATGKEPNSCRTVSSTQGALDPELHLSAVNSSLISHCLSIWNTNRTRTSFFVVIVCG